MNEPDRILADKTTKRIIGAAYTVANALGSGFLEKVYENALLHELRKIGLGVERQKAVRVFYDGIVVGEYVADLLVQGLVVVELKAVRALDEIHLAQCLNYLKATRFSVCLLINFGNPRIQIRRLVHGF